VHSRTFEVCETSCEWGAFYGAVHMMDIGRLNAERSSSLSEADYKILVVGGSLEN